MKWLGRIGIGLAAAIKLAFVLADHGFTKRLAARIALPAEPVPDIASRGLQT